MVEPGVIIENGIPKTNTPEAEIASIRKIVETLDQFDFGAQIRIIRYLVSRYGIPSWKLLGR